jgi:DNA-binding MarR family transcriptional regulator
MKLNYMTGGTYINKQLLITARKLEKASDMVLSQFGITMSMYEMLLDIQAGIHTTVALAQNLDSTLSNVTHKTKLLEEKRYITRNVNKEDKRVWYFSITPKGLQLLSVVNSIYEHATSQLYSQFTPQQMQTVTEFLKQNEEHLSHIVQSKNEVEAFVKQLLKKK